MHINELLSIPDTVVECIDPKPWMRIRRWRDDHAPIVESIVCGYYKGVWDAEDFRQFCRICIEQAWRITWHKDDFYGNQKPGVFPIAVKIVAKELGFPKPFHKTLLEIAKIDCGYYRSYVVAAVEEWYDE